jgi:hypothetical protein
MSEDIPQPEIIPLAQIHRRLTIEFEFRLMILLPSSDFGSRIECCLEHAVIESCKPYEALSYVWGDPVFNKQIILDGQELMITSNLETALRGLRLPATERTLWCDAICINQRDLAERREQVGHMRRIYSNCASDIVWLGTENPECSRGMDIIKRLEGFNLEQIESLGWDSVELNREEWSTQSEFGDGQHSEIPRKRWIMDFFDAQAIQELLNYNAIWRRIWIKQEIACAPKVILTCGTKTLDWSLVEAILAGGRYYTDAFHTPFRHVISRSWTEMFGPAKLITNQREALRKGENSSLLDVLARFKDAVSTDPRDMVYGLLGLVSDTLGVQADYTKSVREIYTDVTLALINSSANLDIICQSPWQRPSSREKGSCEGLPDWVPDFSNPARGEFLFAQRGIYASARPTCVVPCVVESPGTILLNGFFLGRLNAHVGTNVHAPGINSIVRRGECGLQTLVRHLCQANLTMDKTGYNTTFRYRTGEDQVQAFWRTLVGDCKGYPTERLTPDDISHDHSIIREVVAGELATEEVTAERFCNIRSCNVLSKLVRNHWCFYTSDTELFVLAQHGTLGGDVVAILDGAKVPMVLRPIGEDMKGNMLYRPMGGAYVHGFMDGEVLALEDEYKEQVFRVV